MSENKSLSKSIVFITWLNAILVGILLINRYLSNGDITIYVVITSLVIICSIIVTIAYYKSKDN